MKRPATAAARPVPAQLAGAGLGVLALLWPALYNGYPLVSVDTARHLGLGTVDPAHPYGYNLWLYPLFAWNLPWAVVAAQAALTMAMLWLALDLTVGVRSPGWRTGMVVGAAGCTSASLAASMLLPDFFTAIGLLAVVLAPQAARRSLRIALGALVFCAALTHYSHAPLFAAALATAAVLHLLIRGVGKAPPWRPTAPAFAIVAAGVLLTALNGVVFKRWTYSIAGPTFVFGRLQADGPGADFLAERCAVEQLRLCAQLDRLPLPHAEFLWTEASPVARAGGFVALSSESARLVRGTLLSRPGAVLRTLAGNTAAQLRSFVYFPDEYATKEPWFWKMAALQPSFEKGVRLSKQVRGGFRRAWSASLQQATAIVGAALLAPLCWLCVRRGEPQAAVTALTLGAAVVYNAVITGGLSAPDPRYGSRVIWLLPAAAKILVAAITRRRRTESAAR